MLFYFGAVVCFWDVKRAIWCTGAFGKNFDRYSKDLNVSEKLYDGLVDPFPMLSFFHCCFLKHGSVLFSGNDTLHLSLPRHALFSPASMEKDSQVWLITILALRMEEKVLHHIVLFPISMNYQDLFTVYSLVSSKVPCQPQRTQEEKCVFSMLFLLFMKIEW